jgi:pilus assembly protein Flp/PilA
MSQFFARSLSILNRALVGEDGQGLTEYGLILVLVAVVAVVALTFLSGSLQSQLTSVATSV